MQQIACPQSIGTEMSRYCINGQGADAGDAGMATNRSFPGRPPWGFGEASAPPRAPARWLDRDEGVGKARRKTGEALNDLGRKLNE